MTCTRPGAADRRDADDVDLVAHADPAGESVLEATTRRAREYAGVFRPANAVERFLVAQVATESVRVEQCQAEERALTAVLARRAADPDGWDEDRRLEAEEVGARLARDPACTVRRLRQTLQGCDWLLLRWEGLGRALETGRPWADDQRSLALDLLGVPKALRVGPTPVDTGPVAGDGPTLDHQRALVVTESARLQTLIAGVMPDRDAIDREAAELGVAAGSGTATLARLRRYEAACHRRMERATRMLLSGRLIVLDAARAEAETPAEPARPATSRPAPAPAPAPAPPPRVPVPPVSQAPPPTPPTTTAAVPGPERPRGNRRWRKDQKKRLARSSAA